MYLKTPKTGGVHPNSPCTSSGETQSICGGVPQSKEPSSVSTEPNLVQDTKSVSTEPKKKFWGGQDLQDIGHNVRTDQVHMHRSSGDQVLVERIDCLL